MRYALGVDAGNSKTHALVVDEHGQVVGFGQGGPGNHQQDGLRQAEDEIERAVRSALEPDGLAQDTVELGCFCLAGADLPEDYALLQDAMEALGLARTVVVKNDTMAALRAGLSRPWGVVVICGAGFNAAGRAPDGGEIVLPALGPISGDWGGGGDLAQEMIRLVMRAWDGRGQPTLLTRLVLENLQLPTVEALLSKLYHEEIDHQRRLELVPLLFKAGEAGDEVACELIVRAGREVGVTARTLIRRLGLAGEDVEVVLGGGVFKGKGRLFTDTISQVVHAEAPRVRLIRLKHEPVVGAALLALEAMGVVVDAQLYQTLENTLPDPLRIPAPETAASE